MYLYWFISSGLMISPSPPSCNVLPQEFFCIMQIFYTPTTTVSHYFWSHHILYRNMIIFTNEIPWNLVFLSDFYFYLKRICAFIHLYLSKGKCIICIVLHISLHKWRNIQLMPNHEKIYSMSKGSSFHCITRTQHHFC